MEWTKEDIEKVESFIKLKQGGYYCDGKQLTEVYNRLLNKKAPVTNCGSCIRQRISELEDALRKYKASETLKEDKVDNSPQEENKAHVEPANESMKERMARVRAARKK